MQPISGSIVVAAPPAAVFDVYADVAGWSRWDPDTRAAALDGPFAAGTRGWLQPRKGLRVAMVVVEADPSRGFTVECPVLGNRMRFEHRLEPHPEGVRVTHQVGFSGWLARWLDRVVGGEVRQGMPATLAGLKRQVEQGAAGR